MYNPLAGLEYSERIHRSEDSIISIISDTQGDYIASSAMSDELDDFACNSGCDAENDRNTAFSAIQDRFTSLDGVRAAIEAEGLESCRLIFGIDYTISNRSQGTKTFGGKSLHDLGSLNPYQENPQKPIYRDTEDINRSRFGATCYEESKVICILGEVLEPLNHDPDGTIPAFGFGDSITLGNGVFKLKPEEGECRGFMDLLEVYEKITPKVHLCGPTNFAPLIDKAVEIVKKSGNMYHILVIVADGQVSKVEETSKSIERASDYPLSIIMIGVGDGPWDMMGTFDNLLPKRRFDNFQFVNFHQIMSTSKNPQATLALQALMEIPDQYKTIKNLKLLNK